MIKVREIAQESPYVKMSLSLGGCGAPHFEPYVHDLDIIDGQCACCHGWFVDFGGDSRI